MIERTPIFRNLDYQTSWLGLTFDDLPFLLAPIGLSMLGMIFFELSPGIVLGVGVCTLVGMALLKYKKPRGYLWLLLESLFLPRQLSHKARDTRLSPLVRLPSPPRPGGASRSSGRGRAARSREAR